MVEKGYKVNFFTKNKPHLILIANAFIVICILVYVIWLAIDMRTNSFNSERQKFVNSTSVVMQEVNNYEVCRAALAGEAVLSKLVFSDTEIYQITARYITADGKPYIIGMVKSIDPSDSLVLDGENHSGFAGKLASYHENMYKDILTNVYNRRYYEEQLKSNRM